MKGLLIVVFGFAALWDSFTTVFGTVEILGEQGLQVTASVIFAAIIAGFLLSTAYIFHKGGLVGQILIVFWFIALGYDLFTSYTGNLLFIMGGKVSDVQTIVLIGMTILVSSSPILISLILDDD